MPICDRCQSEAPADEIHEFNGQDLCDDCYMDALSPAKSCDPWATYTASRLDDQTVNQTQEKILALVAEKGQASAAELCDAVGLNQEQLKRELASLRHMERIGGKPDGQGGVVFKLFGDKG